ncbi:MAG TPA: hypothetical protein DIT01_05080 [Lentisphaeria bacterium]|nr:hypothetical protein [Lentisphaeria bacterium]
MELKQVLSLVIISGAGRRIEITINCHGSEHQVRLLIATFYLRLTPDLKLDCVVSAIPNPDADGTFIGNHHASLVGVGLDARCSKVQSHFTPRAGPPCPGLEARPHAGRTRVLVITRPLDLAIRVYVRAVIYGEIPIMEPKHGLSARRIAIWAVSHCVKHELRVVANVVGADSHVAVLSRPGKVPRSCPLPACRRRHKGRERSQDYRHYELQMFHCHFSVLVGVGFRFMIATMDKLGDSNRHKRPSSFAQAYIHIHTYVRFYEILPAIARTF